MHSRLLGSSTNCSRDVFWIERVNPNTLTEMIEDVDEDEIVSILFLIMNRNTDIPKCLKLLETDNALTKLISIKDINNWEEKLLEILLLIKNIKIIKKLGLIQEIKEMKRRFKCDVHDCSKNLNSAMKSLYFLCENLSITKTKELIKEAYKHVQIQIDKDKIVPLEIHILQWVQSEYISIDDGNYLIHYCT